MTPAEILARLDAGDLTGGILAAAELREQRANAVPEPRWFSVASEWVVAEIDSCNCGHSAEVVAMYGHEQYCGIEPVLKANSITEADYIAAEANPGHALAAAALWRGVAERHAEGEAMTPGPTGRPVTVNSWYCLADGDHFPCLDLDMVVAAVRAYLGATGPPLPARETTTPGRGAATRLSGEQ